MVVSQVTTSVSVLTYGSNILPELLHNTKTCFERTQWPWSLTFDSWNVISLSLSPSENFCRMKLNPLQTVLIHHVDRKGTSVRSQWPWFFDLLTANSNQVTVEFKCTMMLPLGCSWCIALQKWMDGPRSTIWPWLSAAQSWRHNVICAVQSRSQNNKDNNAVWSRGQWRYCIYPVNTSHQNQSLHSSSVSGCSKHWNTWQHDGIKQ